MFSVGLRFAMPVLALLILLDLSFAVHGQSASQFQVMSLSFAAKMLADWDFLTTAVDPFTRTSYRTCRCAYTFHVLVRLLES